MEHLAQSILLAAEWRELYAVLWARHNATPDFVDAFVRVALALGVRL